MANNSQNKILLATGIYPPDIGGPATYSKLLFDELPRFGYEVEVLSFGSVRHLPKLFRHGIYCFRLALKAWNADFIFAQDTVSVGLPALVVSKLFRKKFLIRVPGDYAWEQAVQRYGVKESIDDFQHERYGFKVELLRTIQRRVVRGANVVITPSNYFKKLVSGWLKNSSTLHTIYNGIDLKDIGSKEEAREALAIDSEAFVIVSAGRLVPWKGFKEVINAVQKLSFEFPHIKLFILGDGPQRSGLEAHINELKAQDFCTLTGNLKRDELLRYMKASDMFMLNSGFESFSFQTVEAMNSKTAVAVSRIGSLPELVEDSVSGFLFSVNDEAAMIDCIRTIATQRDRTKEMIEKAYERSKQFAIDTTLKNLITLLK